jgi:hypothetical protein
MVGTGGVDTGVENITHEKHHCRKSFVTYPAVFISKVSLIF